jgi:hypothetical protein
MNLDSVTGSIQHMWGVVVPPLLNLIILGSIIGMGIVHYSDNNTGGPPPPASERGQLPKQDNGKPQNAQDPDSRSIQIRQLETQAISYINDYFESVVKSPDHAIVGSSVTVLGQIFKLIGTAAGISFTALLYILITILAIMLILDLITRSLSSAINFLLQRIGFYSLIKYILSKTHILEKLPVGVFRFSISSILRIALHA